MAWPAWLSTPVHSAAAAPEARSGELALPHSRWGDRMLAAFSPSSNWLAVASANTVAAFAVDSVSGPSSHPARVVRALWGDLVRDVKWHGEDEGSAAVLLTSCLVTYRTTRSWPGVWGAALHAGTRVFAVEYASMSVAEFEEYREETWDIWKVLLRR